jgi:hypothetical protein
MRAYSHQGHGPRADQTGRIHISDFRNPRTISIAKRSRSIHVGQPRKSGLSPATSGFSHPTWQGTAAMSQTGQQCDWLGGKGAFLGVDDIEKYGGQSTNCRVRKALDIAICLSPIAIRLIVPPRSPPHHQKHVVAVILVDG